MAKSVIARARTWRQLKVALTATVVVPILAACASTVGGHAVPGATPVDLESLNVGPYATEAVDYEPEYDSKAEVFRIESRRMLGFLVAPFEVDPDLTNLEATQLLEARSSVFSDPPFGVLPSEFLPVAERNYLIAGAATTRSNGSVRELKNMVHTVMRFPSEAYARTASAEFATALGERVPGLRQVPLPGHDGLTVVTANDQKGYVFAGRGSYAVVTMVTMARPDIDALTGQFRKLIDLQFERLDANPPTPIDEILDLPQDPEGYMRRVLPPGPSEYATSYEELVGVYGPAQQIHVEHDGPGAKQIFEETGVDLVGQHDARLYRARDAEAAFRLHTFLSQPGKDDEEVDNPPGITDARCLGSELRDPIRDTKFRCVLVYGRYVAVVFANTQGFGFDPSLHQRAAAQYSMLARSE